MIEKLTKKPLKANV